ncbi:signal recognition particle-docking protein FtsY [bacterium]|nr:MAG: signal recognition particle-docking protein FtsY [bacterium]
MFKKLTDALKKTHHKVATALNSIIPFGKKLSKADIDIIEEILITADVGVDTTTEIIDELEQRLNSGELTGEDALEVLENHLMNILGETRPIIMDIKPYVILIVGVNGTGKTTTIGKLAYRFKNEGKKVLLAAGDTFRAAAKEQLAIWANRVGVDMVAGADKADPASVIFDAISKAKAKHYDVVIADTAGRLHTRKNLMEELKKIERVSNKARAGAPDDSFLIVDATTGQNGLTQAEVFGKAISISGIILTKLDGTARGGIAVAITRKLGIPIRMVGVGENVQDLVDFNPEEYIKAMLEI